MQFFAVGFPHLTFPPEVSTRCAGTPEVHATHVACFSHAPALPPLSLLGAHSRRTVHGTSPVSCHSHASGNPRRRSFPGPPLARGDEGETGVHSRGCVRSGTGILPVELCGIGASAAAAWALRPCHEEPASHTSSKACRARVGVRTIPRQCPLSDTLERSECCRNGCA